MRWWQPGPRTTLTLICAVCTGAVLVLHLAETLSVTRALAHWLPYGAALRVQAVEGFVARWYRQLESRSQDWLSTNPAARRAAHHPMIVFLGRDTATNTLDEVMGDELAKSRALQLISEAKPTKARWNREVWALIAERILVAGAKVVVFDVEFPFPGEGDAAFRETLDRHPGRIVIGSNLTFVVEAGPDGLESNKPQLELPTPTLIEPRTDDPRIGFVNVRPDDDGLVRRVSFRTSLLEWLGFPAIDGMPELYSLPAQALRQIGHADLVPTSREPMRFRFARPFLARSLYEIFVDSIWTQPPYNSGELFRDKIVFIGASGNQSEDRIQTPLGTVLGPDIHLNALNAALTGEFLRDPSPRANIASIVAAGVVAWLLGAGIRGAQLRLGLLAGCMLLYYVGAQVVHNSTSLLPLLLSPLAALAGSGLTWFAWEQRQDQREKARIRRTMERYLSKDLTKELIDNRETFLNSLGGVRRCITVLFSDVRGFTTIVESAEDPAALVTQLNEYFGEMVRIVFEQNGRLDKFIGDAVMAEWGGLEPLSAGVETDACRAVAAAVAMRKELARLNAAWALKGMLELKFGIGINHGEAIIGNLGSEEKMEVSVIGDAVNLASRLEGATKEFHLDLLIGERVADFVREQFVLRTVDLLQVKGKTKPVEVFTVLDARAPGVADPVWLTRYEEGIRLYRDRAFAEAAACFESAGNAQPDDWLCGEYLRRCRAYQAEPPAADWDRVFVMTKK